MKCLNCGAELPEGAKFCGSCGASAMPPQEPVAEEQMNPAETPVWNEETVAEAAAPAEEKAPSKVKLAMAAVAAKVKPVLAPVVEKCKPFVQKNKLYLTGAACLVLMLVMVLIVVSIFTAGNGYTPFEHAISAFVSNDGEVLLRYDNKKIIKTGIEAESIGDTQVSIDGNVYAFLTSEDQLVVAKGKKVTVVSDDVTEFKLSVTGKGIGYVTENEDGEATLKLHKVGSKKSTTVLEDFNYASYAMSPDGKSMAYFKYDSENGESDLMFFNGSKHTKITSSKVVLVGLANKGKYIYAVGTNDENDTILYSYNTKGDKQKLGDCMSTAFCFNEDHTQVLFFDGNMSLSEGVEYKTYIATKGKEAKKVSSSLATPMVPQGSEIFTQGVVATIPTDTLFNKVYSCFKDGQYNAWVIKKNVDKSSKLASNIDDAVLDASAEYLYYTDKDNDLKMLKISHGDRASDKAKLIAEDVESFVVTSDRKRVYFVSEDSLYSVKGKSGKGKRTIASEDVARTLVLNQDDICYYYVDGDVHACSNGKKGKLVVADAEKLYAYANGVVYVETDDAMYATKTAKKPAKIYSEG